MCIGFQLFKKGKHLVEHEPSTGPNTLKSGFACRTSRKSLIFLCVFGVLQYPMISRFSTNFDNFRALLLSAKVGEIVLKWLNQECLNLPVVLICICDKKSVKIVSQILSNSTRFRLLFWIIKTSTKLVFASN